MPGGQTPAAAKLPESPEERLKTSRLQMEEGCLELTSSHGRNARGTQTCCCCAAPSPLALVCARQQHTLLAARFLEPPAAPAPPLPPPVPRSLEGPTAPRTAQWGRERPESWGVPLLGHPHPALRLFRGALWVQTLPCPSNTAVLLGLCPLPAPQPRQPPPHPPAQLCPITPTEGLGVASPLIYHLSGGGLKNNK